MTAATTFGDALERTMASGVPAAVAKAMSTETPELLAPSKSVLGFIAIQPDSANAGDSYVVTTGVNANAIAIRGADGVWHFTTPYQGYLVYDQQSQAFYQFDGSAWQGVDIVRTQPRTVSASSGSKTVLSTDSKIFLDGSGGSFSMTYPKTLKNQVTFWLIGAGLTPVTIQDDATPTPNSIVLINAGQAFAQIVGDGAQMRAGYVQ